MANTMQIIPIVHGKNLGQVMGFIVNMSGSHYLMIALNFSKIIQHTLPKLPVS